MDHKDKSKEEFAKELNELRQVLRNVELERFELEKTLGESLARYRAIVEDQTELICRFAPDGTLTFVNEAYCRFFNKRREDLIGFSFMPLIPPEDMEKVRAHFDSLGPENPVGTHEHQVIGKNEEICWQQWTNRAIFHEQGGIKEFQSVGRDVTGRKLAEEELRQARDDMENKVEERARELLEANEQLKREIKNRKREKSRRRESEAYMEAILNVAPIGIGLVKNRVFGWVSQRMSQMLGYSADELVGQSARMVYESEEEFERVGRVKYSEIKERGIGTVETRVKHKNGSLIDALLCSSALDPGELAKGVIFTVLDITERKRAQETLQESEKQFAVFMDNLPAGVLMKDEDSRVLYVNKYLKDHFAAEAWVGRDVSQNLPREKAHSVRADDLKALREGPITILESHTDSKGIERIFQTFKFPIEGQDGRRLLGGILIDITERKMAEKALQESEEKYRRLIESSIDGIAIVQETEVKFANQALLNMYGTLKEEVVGHDFTKFVSHEHRDLLVQRGLDRERGKDVPNRYEFKALRQDGTEFDAEISVNPTPYEGKPARQAFLRDISERKRAEGALRKREAELAAQSRHLEEVNVALNILLKRREEDKNDLEENILANVKELVLPYVEKLKNSRLHSDQMTLVGILESNIKEIVSAFVTKLSSRFLSLTPTEIKVASLIKDGKTSKEIAFLLNASENTIRSHRFHMRSKLDLKNKKVNLRSYLRSLQE